MAKADIHLTQKNTPFETEFAAKTQAARIKKETGMVLEAIPHEGGFALRETGEQISPTQETKVEEHKAITEQEPRKESAKVTESRPDRLAEKRKKRAEIGVRSPLEARIPPGFVGRWVLDNPKLGGKRLRERINKGWDYVSDTTNTPVAGDVNRASQMGSVVTMPAGSGGTLYLMVIEQELANEDRAAYNARLDEIDRQMRKGAEVPGISGTGMTEHVTNPQVLSR